MTPLDAMKQALEALEAAQPRSIGALSVKQYVESITNLRASIEQMENRAPSLWINCTTKDCTFNPRTNDNWLKQGYAVNAYYKD